MPTVHLPTVTHSRGKICGQIMAGMEEQEEKSVVGWMEGQPEREEGRVEDEQERTVVKEPEREEGRVEDEQERTVVKEPEREEGRVEDEQERTVVKEPEREEGRVEDEQERTVVKELEREEGRVEDEQERTVVKEPEREEGRVEDEQERTVVKEPEREEGRVEDEQERTVVKEPEREEGRVEEDDEGHGDVKRLKTMRTIRSNEDYETMVFSKTAAELRLVRRETVISTAESADKLKESGCGSREDLRDWNCIGRKLHLAQISLQNKLSKKAASEAAASADSQANGTKNNHVPKAGDIFQADICIRLEEDANLQYIFNGMIANCSEDVKSLASMNQESFNDVRVNRGEYVCFEITRAIDKILAKIFQLSRLYAPGGLKDHFLGRQAKIRAFGLIVSGNRRDFESACDKVRAFFVETSKNPNLSKNLINQSIPFFLCLVNHETLYSQVTDLKLSVERLTETTEGLKETTEGLKETTEGLKETTEGLQETTEGLKKSMEMMNKSIEERFSQQDQNLKSMEGRIVAELQKQLSALLPKSS
ncbi:hypothetical protein GUITHDRAFT_118166 [Guillardia theta CCMP2712]|uniref:Uncharacterized protein n=1 Tax=Guillardia theta (strain CCMP2712) TaxID=905079 RepID=L1IIN2_GUITC|nr:hypothetical protein GUITHDRAFT_118166 [Guillardia theta CCMP2712]EKX35675.1 hypothetical protein GUITHDRAFT_118166 [Guillardia theta CCMP2712]|eukprot:XP_005822655.1 hypothetical protein GUITHDRAFT_118166 [Guillardia theta CCMP2712]